jgi:excisionase family DNA binding protein
VGIVEGCGVTANQSTSIGRALIDNLDDEALAALADKLAPFLAERLNARAANRLLSARDVAAILGLHERTVSRMAAEGRLEARKVGRGWRFDPGRLDVAARTPRDFEPPRRVLRRPRAESAGVTALRAIQKPRSSERST